jgi:hypothetical protein
MEARRRIVRAIIARRCPHDTFAPRRAEIVAVASAHEVPEAAAILGITKARLGQFARSLRPEAQALLASIN